MSRKLHELQRAIGAGARSNKYRVMMPMLGQKLDILCHNVQSPGRGIGTIDVYLKGREYKIAGDRADEGSITMTFYNDPNLILRRFFLKLIAGVQSYVTPETIQQTFNEFSDIQTDIFNESSFLSLGMNTGWLTDFYQQIRNNLNTIKVSANFEYSITPGTGYNFYAGRPWYMSDMQVIQLDNNEQPAAVTTLKNAFVSNIDNIEYTDETGEISQSTVTITYSGIDYGDGDL
jgi:hypothetical protein